MTPYIPGNTNNQIILTKYQYDDRKDGQGEGQFVGLRHHLGAQLLHLHSEVFTLKYG
jgi:hypothetical protein